MILVDFEYMSDIVKSALITGGTAILVAIITGFATITANKSGINEASDRAEITIDKAKITIQELRELLKQLPNTQLKWERARLEKGWSIYDSGYSDPYYAKDILGFVHLRGLAQGGGQGKQNPLMFLPKGFRPKYRMDIVVSCDGQIPCEIIIEKDGRVWFAVWNVGWVGLDNISFEADSNSLKSIEPNKN